MTIKEAINTFNWLNDIAANNYFKNGFFESETGNNIVVESIRNLCDNIATANIIFKEDNSQIEYEVMCKSIFPQSLFLSIVRLCSFSNYFNFK